MVYAYVPYVSNISIVIMSITTLGTRVSKYPMHVRDLFVRVNFVSLTKHVTDECMIRYNKLPITWKPVLRRLIYSFSFFLSECIRASAP